MMGFYRKQGQRQTAHWTAVALLWLAFALLVSSAVQKSATVDEQSHLFRGIAYLRQGATHFLLGHPLGASAWSALPLLTEADLILPLNTPAWESGNWSLAGDAFLWQLNANPLRLIFLGRLPVMWLTLLLGALVFRWGRQLAGPTAGLVALALLLFDPNVLAHGRLITGDLALTLFFTTAVYGYWLWARQSRRAAAWHWPALLLTGAALGLAAVSKFNAALLLPVLTVLGLGLSWRRRTWRPLLALVVAGLVGGVVVWLVYGLALRPLPGGAFWDDLFWQLQYTGRGHGQYLFGEASAAGWWYYFPVAFLLKTPLPTLALLLLALAVAVWQKAWRLATTWFLLLPVLFYLAASMASALNIGVRYLLPMLPFLYLATAVSLWRLADGVWARRTAAAGAAAVVLISLWQWPHYIPYFNTLAGGPANSWRLLSDSNVDWGQDLPALAAWQRQTDQPLQLSYFGTAHPSAYGLDFTPLPTWAAGPEQGDPARQAYNPANPAPGFYAISVTNLHGVVLGEAREAYAWFREREPLARIGDSIFVYSVEADGPPVHVAFSGTRPGALAAELAAQWATNDVRPRWFAAQSSLIWPGEGGWLVVEGERPSLPELAALWPEEMVTAVGGQALYRLPAPPQWDWADQVVDFGPLVYLGWQRSENGLLTAWRVAAETERPLKIFVHALDERGEIVAQWDGLDVDPSTWQPGDVLAQAHPLAAWDMAGIKNLSIGLYDAVTGERLGEPVSLGSVGQ
ncbi:MAG: phospholipid carrier-dependent glycosyltransferase [Chloroflexi bacterium]|nr:phospholipid carrier-dependent glycosyltransferase [Chloroflexota bacterium]